MSKHLLAEALRQYATFADAYIAARHELDAAKRLLLHIEGTLLAYWTDIPQSELLELTVRLRDLLGDYEPTGEQVRSRDAT